MATFNISRFAKPDGLKSVAPEILLALFEPHRTFFENRGTTLPHGRDAKNLDYDSLIKVLMEPAEDTPRELVDALYYIDEMATPEGMDSILREIEVRSHPVDLPENPTPAEVAIRLWLSEPGLLMRKHAETFLSRQRSFESYLSVIGSVPTSPRLQEENLTALETELDNWFATKKRGRGTRVAPFSRSDNTWFLVRHGDPYKREGTLERNESSSVFYRPEKHDVIIHYGAIGELRVHAASKGEKDQYRRAFGLHLFGDEKHFPEYEKYTLEPLRTDGPASLICTDVEGIESIVLKEVQIYWGGAQHEVEIRRASDVFAALTARARPIPEKGHLRRASFSMRFRGNKTPRTVVVQPPNTARFTRDSDGVLVEDWLLKRGFVIARREND